MKESIKADGVVSATEITLSEHIED